MFTLWQREYQACSLTSPAPSTVTDARISSSLHLNGLALAGYLSSGVSPIPSHLAVPESHARRFPSPSKENTPMATTPTPDTLKAAANLVREEDLGDLEDLLRELQGRVDKAREDGRIYL